MESAVKKFAEHDPVFGICGGYQMLGMCIRDPHGVEEAGEIRGLELLPMETELTMKKRRSRVQGTITLTEGVLASLGTQKIMGYEIHMGRTCAVQRVNALCQLNGEEEEKAATQDGGQQKNVYGTYVHGIFDEGTLAYDLCQCLAKRKGVCLENPDEKDYQRFKEKQYDLLADGIRKHMDMKRIYEMLQEAAI